MVREGGDAERERQHGGVVAELVLDRGADVLGEEVGLVLGGARQQDRELLAAGAGYAVAPTAVPEQHPAGADERQVAGTVAEPVVHGLEVVEVADHDAQRLARGLRDLDLGLQFAVEREAVPEAGESVGEGGLGEAVHELGDAIAHGPQDARGREEDPDQSEPPCRHGVKRGGGEEDGEVRAGHEGELHGRLARAEEVGGVEAEPDVEHLARQRGLVLGAPDVSRHEHRAQRGERREEAWTHPARARVEEDGDDCARGRDRHAPPAEPVRAG